MFHSPRLTLPSRETYNHRAMSKLVLTAAETALLAESDLLRGTLSAERARVNQLWKRKTIRKGEPLMTVQQPGDALYFIMQGAVKIHIEQTNGGDVFIDISSTGDTVGEMSIVDSDTRSATATAMEDTATLWMERRALKAEMNRAPLLAQNIARIISNRLRHATARIQIMATQDTFGRVAYQLLFFATRYGKPADAGILIPLHLTQGDLADLVGATRERVNRVMGTFKRAHLLSIDAQNRITLQRAQELATYIKR